MIAAVESSAPADALQDIEQPGLLGCQTLLISASDLVDPTDQPVAVFRHTEKAHSPRIGQRLLCRVEHLNDETLESAFRETADALFNFIKRR